MLLVNIGNCEVKIENDGTAKIIKTMHLLNLAISVNYEEVEKALC